MSAPAAAVKVGPRIVASAFQSGVHAVLKFIRNALKGATPQNEESSGSPPQKADRRPPNATGTFAELGLIQPLLKALEAQGYSSPTPIQKEAIPHVLQGRDVLGCAQTGTGKTAAFALPMIQRLVETKPARPKKFRALVLAPTRELAIQIGESFGNYGAFAGLKYAVIFGGVGQQPQVDALRRGPEIVVATPGRLLDLMNQRHVDFPELEIFVLDEADRMLDMGFINDVRKVLKVLPKKRQNLFFTATMPAEIQSLSSSILHDPAKIAVAPVSSTAESVSQSIYFVDQKLKSKLLQHLLQSNPEWDKVLVFTRTKHGANRVAESLEKIGVGAEAIHGNKSQSARQRALSNFKDGKTRVLVASDLASRGIDVVEISHVINFDLPNVPETYVHRIGRTGRANATGDAVGFCSREEQTFLRDIERLIKKKIPVVEGHPYPPGTSTDGMVDVTERSGGGGGRGRGGGGGRGRGGPPRQNGGGGGGGGGGRGPRPQGQGGRQGSGSTPRDGAANPGGSRRPRNGGRGGGGGSSS